MDCRYAIPTAGLLFLHLCRLFQAPSTPAARSRSSLVAQSCLGSFTKLGRRSPAGFIIVMNMRKLLPGAVDYDKAAGGIIRCDTDVTVGWQNGTRLLQRQQRSGK